MQWDPQQYLRFADERGRPFFDLMTRVGAQSPASVVDLGCGPGNLTRTLAERWPDAHVTGVDSSPQMIAEAATLAVPGALDFVCADLREWTPAGPVDVLVSNATLQWVPDHLDQIDRLAGSLAADGWLAFQVPGNLGEPSHTLLHELAGEPRWRSRMTDDVRQRLAVHQPAEYVERLASRGLTVDAWETTYLHILPGEDAVLEWVKGTGARPVLAAFDAADREEFLAEYGAALRTAYPKREFGTILPFRRIFVVARR